MATAVLRSHDALNNRMHLDAFAPSPTRPRRRRSPKPAGASSSPPPPKAQAVPRMTAAASPPARTAAPGRRSPPPPPKTAARKQPPSSPTRDKPPMGMEQVRILKRGEEPPAPIPEPALVLASPVVAASNKRAIRSTNRIGPKEPTVVPRKVVSGAAGVAVYAGPAFNSAAPEPSSLPFPAFCLRRDAETEATRGLRCLLGIGQVA